MADIVEEENWKNGVYQLETSDPVQGGADGVDNLPHKALANRTLWLKAQLLLKALVGGSASQRFRVASAIADDEAITKSQFDSGLSNIDLSSKVDKSAVIGINQTWQDVSTSRKSGVTYTNTTGKPIMVMLTFNHDNTIVNLYINGNSVAYMSEGTQYGNISFILPDGDNYQVQSNAGGNMVKWQELR